MAVSTGAEIDVDAVVKRFRAGGTDLAAVDGVTLRLPSASVTALTGPSGSGKSTLLHLIGGIERADSGRILVDGDDITAMDRRGLTAYRRRIGFVFQRFHLLPALTALDNVLAPVLPFRVDFDRAARARELLDRVGLAGRHDALPAQLSGGQQQRVAIARALIARPTLLLADEPTGALDSDTGSSIMDLLWELRAEHGMTLVIATHEDAVARRCEHLVRLRDGALVSP
ncbi:ABC transporter ATP-binding protein [Longispora sp. NPDC051575]|uniref:ABC transporter ATP-binding protein n=1 Tax=Longispora sp. NPDC051575 TaxID=3154943 RepID=UPI00342867DB